MDTQTQQPNSLAQAAFLSRVAELQKEQLAEKQLAAVQEVVSELGNVSKLLGDDTKQDAKTSEEIKMLLESINQSLATLSTKEDPENPDVVSPIVAALVKMETALASAVKGIPVAPDVSKPIVDALSKLEGSLTASVKAISITPTFKPSINVDSPAVNVSSPKVDLSGVENILKTDIPTAFAKAVQLIPAPKETDLSPLLDSFAAIQDRLASIDHATRLKPQAPERVKVVNPDGTNIGVSADPFVRYQPADIDDAGTVQYFGYTDIMGGWYIMKFDTSVAPKTIRYVAGNSDYSTNFTNRASLTFTVWSQ